MSRDLLKAMLKKHEGTGPMAMGRYMPYRDCCGKQLRDCVCQAKGATTIAFGHNLEARGLTYAQAERLLDEDIDDTLRDLVTRMPWIEGLDPTRVAVLTDMAFNLGVPKLAAFRKMLAALQRGDYATAAVEMLASDWAEQVGARAWRLAKQMETGVWQ